MNVTIWSNGNKQYADYSHFKVENETNNYRLHVSGYTGNTDIDGWAYHNGSEFSTRDRDNDRDGGQSCSQTYKGAHWYKGCYHINPTGLYKSSGTDSMNINNGPIQVKEMTLKIKSQ